MCPGVRVIVLAPSGTAEEIIAALRARVFLCKTAPFDPVGNCELRGASRHNLRRAGGNRGAVSASRLDLIADQFADADRRERWSRFLNEMQTGLPEAPREELMMAFREILMNAMEHGAEFRPGKVVDVAAVHTARTIVFYVHDPGSGFRWETIEHAAVGNPEGDLTRHVEVRDEKGMRPGGFGILIAKGVVNELIYSEVGNEVLMIKYTA